MAAHSGKDERLCPCRSQHAHQRSNNSLQVRNPPAPDADGDLHAWPQPFHHSGELRPDGRVQIQAGPGREPLLDEEHLGKGSGHSGTRSCATAGQSCPTPTAPLADAVDVLHFVPYAEFRIRDEVCMTPGEREIHIPPALDCWFTRLLLRDASLLQHQGSHVRQD